MAQIGPYQLIEINVISAQDLPQVSKPVRAYAVGWVHPDRRLTTQVDHEGNTNPTWDEKFVFRVDDHLLNSDNAVIMMEIYAQTWLSPVLIGTVAVHVSNLLPKSRKPKPRFVALQILRPSGRPRGNLNIGITLLDNTMRNMPLYSELSSSGDDELMETRKNKKVITEEDREKHSPLETASVLTLQRCQNEKNDSTINDYTYRGTAKRYGYDEQDSEMGVRKGGVSNEDSLISDVGPSPSVVAAAIAKGWYPMPPPRTAESSMVDGWSVNSGNEAVVKKMEKWRAELSPAFEDYGEERMKLRQTPQREGRTPKREGRTPQRVGKTPLRVGKTPQHVRKTPQRVGHTPQRVVQTPQRVVQTPRRGARRREPFSCFGTVFGCEITITCAKGNRQRNNGDEKSRLTAESSELTYDESFI
ncbi:uncharacterized protein LOC124833877 [Vigna umbellata]|uniref:uncharacterized protein LOC124833877 n=1 Tax=Vigna umbellata TaxID=87088 RepID=UPI001F5F11F7|nr:uncharacterized protein LOC124833877 [Vigna umbellata]